MGSSTTTKSAARAKPKATPAKKKAAAANGAAELPEDEYLRLDNQLCFPLYLASRLMVGAYRTLLDELELTYPQYLVLMVLWERDGLSVGALGERLFLDTGTLTPLLKRMEKQGLITRHRRGEDDRVVENRLTDAAKMLKKRAVNVPVSLLCKAELELDDVVRIKGVLEGLVQRLLPLQ
jgi:DNA-binding MarR family transcriptional regulator